MPDPDYRALCAELVESLKNARRIIQGADGTLHINTAEFVLRRARAALAQPEPVAPTDDELLKLLSRASGLPDCDTYIVDGGRIMSEPNELLAFARAVLARWGTPANQPVLVSERLPGPENKTTDDECWFWDPISGCWFLLPGPSLNDHYTHWLPHHSLPIPRGGTH
jgi:hypothetical protein